MFGFFVVVVVVIDWAQDIPEAFKKMTSLRQLLRWTTWIKFTVTRRRPLTPVISNFPFSIEFRAEVLI